MSRIIPRRRRTLSRPHSGGSNGQMEPLESEDQKVEQNKPQEKLEHKL